MTDTQTTRAATDWERVEADYRAGVLSVREIASANGVSHVAIAKRAKKFGWTRDLAAKIQAKADSLVTKGAVTGAVTTETAVTERVIVEANAEAIARVRLSHRKDISKTRDLCLSLLAELEVASKEALTVEQLAELLDKAAKGDDGEGDRKGLSEAMWKAIDRAIQLPSRAGSLKALTDSLKTLVTLEREAWGIAADDKGGEKPAAPVFDLGWDDGGPGIG